MFKFKLSTNFTQQFPEAKIAGILLKNLRPKEPASEKKLANLVDNSVEEIVERNKAILESPAVNAWRNFMLKNTGNKDFKASHIALLERVVKNKQLPRVNTIVDVNNSVSIRNSLPIGTHDIADIQEIRVDSTTGSEQYFGFSETKAETVTADEFAYLDNQNRVLTRHLIWRQSKYSMIKESTTELFIPIDDLLGIKSNTQLEQIAQEIVGLLAEFYDFSYQFGVVSRFNAEILFNDYQDSKFTNKYQHLFARPEVVTDSKKVAQFFDKKIAEIYPTKADFEKLLSSGKRLRFYIGADATAAKMHIGHLVPVLKMAELQKLGHQIIFLIGDFTARIGDPTDKSATRVKLTPEEVATNAQKFKEQIEKYIDFNHPENPALLVFNSDWNSELNFGDVLELASNFTVQQMLERDMFAKRMQENKPIYLHEFLYPLLQGYDSVFLAVDAEFGGSDQTFNMLAGRTLEKTYRNINKFVITCNLLLSADGVNKMSKSIGNCIFIEDSAEDKYGKIMSIPDNLIPHYYELTTNLAPAEIDKIAKEIENSENPMLIKKELAFRVTEQLHDKHAAERAAKHFEATVQGDSIPEDIKQVSRADLMDLAADSDTMIPLKTVLSALKLAESNSDAKRLISSGAVEVDQKKISDTTAVLDIKNVNIIKAGKRNWVKLVD